MLKGRIEKPTLNKKETDMSSKTTKIVQVQNRQNSRPKKDGSVSARWVPTTLFAVGEEGDKILASLNEGRTPTKQWRIIEMPLYDTLEEYNEREVERAQREHLDSASKKLAKLTDEERAALAASLGVDELPGAPADDKGDKDDKSEEGEGADVTGKAA